MILSSIRTSREPVSKSKDFRQPTLATESEASFAVRDEGHGFDPSILPDPTDPENLNGIGGRGVMLIQTFMDDVRYNESGTEITMIKRRADS